MTAHATRKIPATISFAPELCRPDSWGWILELSASRVELSTLSALRADERITLDFHLAERRLGPTTARVIRVEKDLDGFSQAEIRFTDEVFKHELSQAILRLLAATA